MRLPILALDASAFAIGATEFGVMGLTMRSAWLECLDCGRSDGRSSNGLPSVAGPA